jgi:hypothetical protein
MVELSGWHWRRAQVRPPNRAPRCNPVLAPALESETEPSDDPAAIHLLGENRQSLASLDGLMKLFGKVRFELLKTQLHETLPVDAESMRAR